MSNIDTIEFIEDLIESVCIIYVDGLELSFTHRSIQEYFTALFLKELNDDQQKKICMSILKSKGMQAFSDSSVMGMLFDMNKSRFEKNVILPFLQEVISNSIDAYFLKIYTCIYIQRNALCIELNSSNIRFSLYSVLTLYGKEISKPTLFYKKDDDVVTGRLIYKIDGEIGDYIRKTLKDEKFYLDNILNDEKISEILFGEQGVIQSEYRFLLNFKDIIEKNQIDISLDLEAYLLQ